jgi:hypothetical protein
MYNLYIKTGTIPSQNISLRISQMAFCIPLLLHFHAVQTFGKNKIRIFIRSLLLSSSYEINFKAFGSAFKGLFSS